MRNLTNALALVPLVLLGCTVTPELGPPLEVRRECPIECTGAISRHLPPEAEEAPAASDSPGELECDVSVLRTAGGMLADLLGAPFPGSYARVVPAAEARRALRMLRTIPGPEVALEGVLSTARDGQGHLQVREKVSFLDGFALAIDTGAALLDPRIDVALTGLRMDLRARFGASEGPWELDARLMAVELQRPIPSAAVPALAHEGEVRVHLPVYTHVTLAACAELSAGEALLLSGPDPADQGHALLVLITPRRGGPPAE
jgi:hypothetical protein